jgi:hypothetical protein
VQSIAALASVAIPSETVEITFDNNAEIEHNATALYNFMLRSRDTQCRHLLADKISFACRRSVGIQVADLYARETMKHLKGQLESNVPRRGSFAALADTHRFRFKRTDRTDFERSKKKLADFNLEEPADLKAYRQWLRRKRLIDCQSNRIAYLEQFQKDLHLEPTK